MPGSLRQRDPYPGEFKIIFHDRVTEAWSPEYRARYARKIEGIVRQSAKMEREAVRAAVEIMQQTRREVIDLIADTPKDRFAYFQLSELKRAIDEKLDTMESRLAEMVTGRVDELTALGSDEVGDLLSFMGIEVPKVDISPTLAATVRDFTADLITNLTAEARSKITNVINRAAMTGESLTKTLHAIGTNLKDPSVFRSIAVRAETIARTEVMRIQSMAGQARMMQALELVPKLQKQWIAVIDTRTRESHMAADRMYREGGTPGPIPVNRPYIVEGEKLMFPRDPAGSAKNTINCRCRSVPFVPDAEERVRMAA